MDERNGGLPLSTGGLLRKQQSSSTQENSPPSFREDLSVSFRDARATCFTVDSSERCAAVVGRRDVFICDLDSGLVERKFSRPGKWECACAAWSRQGTPTENVIATATNTQLDFFYAVHGATKATVTSGHSRHITDVDWSPDPYVLASSSVDCYIMIYDLRESKPTIALNSVTSVSQVKFNYNRSNIVASAHEGQVKLWDLRKASTAYHFLTAHTSRIYGLEWSRQDENLLVSAAQDGMCKVWDIAGDISDKALLQLHIGLPVLRARFAPFAIQSIATVILPTVRRNNDAVQFWNLEDCKTPVAALPSTVNAPNSTGDAVVDCAWRNCSGVPGVDGPYKFLTFSKESVLKSWVIDASLELALGAELRDDVRFDADDDDTLLDNAKRGRITPNFGSSHVAGRELKQPEAENRNLPSKSFIAESMSPDAVKIKLPITEEITKKLKSFFHPSFDAESAKTLERDNERKVETVVETPPVVSNIDDLKQKAEQVTKTAVDRANKKSTSVVLVPLDIVTTVSGGADVDTISTILSLQARSTLHDVRIRFTFVNPFSGSSKSSAAVPPAIHFLKGTSFSQSVRLNFRSQLITQAEQEQRQQQTILSASEINPISIYVSTLANAIATWPAEAPTAPPLPSFPRASPVRQQPDGSGAGGRSLRSVVQRTLSAAHADCGSGTPPTVLLNENDQSHHQQQNTTGRFLVRRVDENSTNPLTYTSTLVLNRNNSVVNSTTTSADPVEYHVKPRLCGLSFTWYGMLAFSDAFSPHSRRASSHHISNNNMLFNLDNQTSGDSMLKHGTVAGHEIVVENTNENGADGDDDVDGLRSSYAAYFHPGAAAFLKKRHHMNVASSNRTLHSGNIPKQTNYYTSLRLGTAGRAAFRNKFNKSLRATMSKSSAGGKNAEIAVVYDLTALLPVQRELSSYRLDGGERNSFHAACRYNALVAASCAELKNERKRVSEQRKLRAGSADGEQTNENLVGFWKLYELCAAPALLYKQRGVNDQCAWSSRHHPLAAKLLNRLLEHFEERGDVQTVASAVSLLPFVPIFTHKSPTRSVTIPPPPPAMSVESAAMKTSHLNNSKFLPTIAAAAAQFRAFGPPSTLAMTPQHAAYDSGQRAGGNEGRSPSPYHTIHAGGAFRFSSAALQQAALTAVSGERLYPPPSANTAASTTAAFAQADNELLTRKRSQRSSSWSSLNYVLVENVAAGIAQPRNDMVGDGSRLGVSDNIAAAANYAGDTRTVEVRALLSPTSLQRYLPVQVEYALQLYSWLAFVPRREILKTWNFSQGFRFHRQNDLPSGSSKALMLINNQRRGMLTSSEQEHNTKYTSHQQQDRYVIEPPAASPSSGKIPFITNPSKKQLLKSAAAASQKSQNIVNAANSLITPIVTTTNTRTFTNTGRLQLDASVSDLTAGEQQRAEVGSSSSNNDLLNRCDQCGKLGSTGPFCSRCRQFANYCSVCRLPVKGLFMFCSQCGHCGHASCMREWFLTNAQTTCPRACLCQCVLLAGPAAGGHASKATVKAANVGAVDNAGVYNNENIEPSIMLVSVAAQNSAVIAPPPLRHQSVASGGTKRHHHHSSSPYRHHHAASNKNYNQTHYGAQHNGSGTLPIITDVAS